MFPAQFDYYKASSVSEALDLMEEHADEESRNTRRGATACFRR